MTEDTKTILNYFKIKGKKGATRLDFVKLLREHYAAGTTSYLSEAYFFAIARSLIFEADDRFEKAETSDSELIDLSARMTAIRKQHHLKKNEDFWIDDADTPEEYKQLHELWSQKAHQFETSVMLEFGENEMAELYTNDRLNYDRCYDAGFYLFYENDSDFDKTLKDLKESRQEGVSHLEL
jgi:hypothetical protein